MKSEADIGILGGSGVYEMEALENAREVSLETPFGHPSDQYRLGTLSGKRVAFLPRHGRHHTLLPSEIPYRANLYGFKKLGVKFLISISAVGSLKEEICPGDFVFPDQFFDRTKQSREHTFFGEGVVGHVSFGSPVCEVLQTVLYQSAKAMGARCHWNGVYVNIEGPHFSTRAESEFYRSLGYAVVGMTNLAEAKLAREAQMSYATLAVVTDYDCWKQESGTVNAEDVLKVFSQHIGVAKKTIAHAVQQIETTKTTAAHDALANAVVTKREFWSKEKEQMLSVLRSRVT